MSNLIGLEVFNGVRFAAVPESGTGMLLLSAFLALVLVRFSQRQSVAGLRRLRALAGASVRGELARKPGSGGPAGGRLSASG